MSILNIHVSFNSGVDLQTAKQLAKMKIAEAFPGAEVSVYSWEERFGKSVDFSQPPLDGPLDYDEIDDSIDFRLGLGGAI